jgi:hypothetical protein
MSAQDKKKRCDQCEYFEAIGRKAGECRRFPPVLAIIEVAGMEPPPGSPRRAAWEGGRKALKMQTAIYPPVELDCWCGEFKATIHKDR